MPKDRYDPTERIGVSHIQNIFSKYYGWIFREQIIGDMGIDAQVEFVEGGDPKGKLLGIQIKTGASHFYERDDSFTFYIDEAHYTYWINHSLPVLLIGHIPESDLTFWQFVSEENIDKTSKRWKLTIPKSHQLESDYSKEKISQIALSNRESEKLMRLKFDKELMLFLEKGGKISVYTMEWLHKSLGRGPFKVILNPGEDEEIIRSWSTFYHGTLLEVLQQYFPWAELSIDKEFYDDNFDQPSVYRMYNPNYVHTLQIYPYEVLSGEVGNYRVQLKLNQVGRSFLSMENYLNEAD
jgi:hypothetical protein